MLARPACSWALRAACLGVALTTLTMERASGQSARSDLTGRVSLGIRSVDIDGAADKFREDVDLEDGVRLFDLSLSYAPEPGEGSLVDRMDLEARNLGGDPFESLHIGVRKYGAYNFTFDRQRSEYFYRDVILPPALASVSGSTGGDFHQFDFERIRDRASLGITVSPATEVTLELDRLTREGDSTTTLDIQRDEFELERPIDESMNAIKIGVQHSWREVTLIYEHDARDFENSIEAFLPGGSSGLNQDDLAELIRFSLDSSYDYRSSGDLARIVVRPTPRLDLLAAWRRETLDLDMDAAEHAAGTSFAGAPFITDASGGAEVGRDIELQDFDVGYAVSERLRIVGSARRLGLDQRGTLLFGGEEGAGTWDIETVSGEAGFELSAARGLVISAGVSRESRDARRLNTEEGSEVGGLGRTDRDGLFSRLNYRFPSGFEIVASIEDNDMDDPYTLGSPTSSRRSRLQVRHGWNNGLGFAANWRRDVLDNRVSGWAGTTEQGSLRFTYNTESLQAALGLSVIDLSRDIVQAVLAGSRQDVFAIGYAADVELIDGSVRWQLGRRLAIGANGQIYTNGGSFPIERDDLRAFVELGFGSQYLLEIGYRRIDHEEDGFGDYDADLLEAAFGLRW